MKLSNAEMQEIDTILEKYCNTKEALSMKNFCQHGSVRVGESMPLMAVIFFVPVVKIEVMKKSTDNEGLYICPKSI